MMLHCSAHYWRRAEDVFAVCTFFDAVCRWAVPVFVMVSGAIFLNRDIPTAVIWKKYILRMVIAFTVWALFYAVLFHDDTCIMKHFIRGHVHLWFLPMIAGLYALIPLLKPIVADERRTRYFLLLAFVLGFLIPTLITLGRDFGPESMSIYFKALKHTYKNIKIDFKFATYFILGYWLDKTDLPKTARRIIYIFGIIGLISITILTLAVSQVKGSPEEHYFNNFTVSVFMEAVAVFVLFKYMKPKGSAITAKLSEYSFGVYLVHMAVLKQLLPIGEASISVHPVITILSITAVVFIASFAISAALNQIPFIRGRVV